MNHHIQRFGKGTLNKCFLVLAGLAFGLAAGCGPEGGKGYGPAAGGRPGLRDTWPPRAVWVVRQVYRSPEQIAELMEDVQQAGLNTVLFQVRGNGTAFYKSSIEPFAYEYGGDPGFDPLEVACQEAHRRGLALHAWANVMPAWKDVTGRSQPPSDPSQLYNARPEWFWYDQHGRREPIPKDFYVSLNPCLPEVREYLVSVFEEIVRDYPVDGLHLDYIRFPCEVCPKGSDYPYDRTTLSLYKQATGKRPADDRAAWSRWRRDQVTQLVREIRSMMGRARRGAMLSTACAPDIERAREVYLQDGPAWLRKGLIDTAFVMNYTADARTFRLRQEAWQREAGARPVIAGLGVYQHESERVTIEQLRLAERWGQGFCLFSAGSLFGLDDPHAARRLNAIRPVLLEMRSKALATAGETNEDLGISVGASSTMTLQSSGGERRKPRPIVP